MVFSILKHESDLLPPTLIEPPRNLMVSKGVLLVLVDGPEEAKDSLQGVINHSAHEYFESTDMQSSLITLKHSVVSSQVPSGCSVVVAALVGEVLYVVCFGKIEVSLVRDGTRFSLVSHDEPTYLTASGKMKLGDGLALAIKGDPTPAFVEVGLVDAPDEEAVLPPMPSKPIGERFRAHVARTRFFFQTLPMRLRLRKELDLSFVHRIRMKYVVAVCLLFLLVTLGWSVYASISSKERVAKQTEFNALASSIEQMISEAYGIKNLNLSKATELGKQSQSDVAKLKALGVNKEQADTLEAKVALLLTDLQQKVDTKFETVLDLAALQVTPLDFAMNGDVAYVLTSGGDVRSLNILDKKAVPLAHVDEAKWIRATKDRLYVYASSGVYRIDGKTATKVIEYDPKWGLIVDMYAFNNNVYLLDQKEKAVWKYVPGGGGLVLGSNGLGPESSKIVKKPSSVAIDGNIWVVDTDTIYKFLIEKKEDFKVKNFDHKIGENTRLYTAGDDLLRELLLLDKGVGRVVDISKEGQYVAQYSGEEIIQAINLSYNAATKQVLLLTPTKIVRFKLTN